MCVQRRSGGATTDSDLRDDDVRRRAVVRRHPEHGAVVRRQARGGGPAGPVDADGAERACSIAVDDADSEPGVVRGGWNGGNERCSDPADVGAEWRVGLVRGRPEASVNVYQGRSTTPGADLVGRRHRHGAVFFAVDGVDVLGGAGEGEAELVGGAGAGGGDRRDGAAD